MSRRSTRARAAGKAPRGLRYVTDRRPGIRRRRAGRGFRYLTARGRTVDRATRRRIESLAIPPAWERVWICADRRGHLQATGYDARGRKQYRYHPDWRADRDRAKFATLADFGRVLPTIRRTVARHLALAGMPREKVVACVVHLLDTALIRIGNDEYARENESYGLTTIRNRHARVRSGAITLTFRAKSGRLRQATIESPRAARIVRRCQHLPGQKLFCYLDPDGKAHDVGSTDVNRYLASVAAGHFTSKDFRTWGGSVTALAALRALGFPPAGETPSIRERKRREVAAIDAAAERLGNTRAVCRRYYVHPAVIDGDVDGRLEAAFAWSGSHPRPSGLRTAERALLRLLQPRRRKTSA